MSFIWRAWVFVKQLFVRSPPVAGDTQPIEPAPVVSESPAKSLPELPQETLNRQQRRKLSALERARRRHDKFVTPQGTPPAPIKLHRERLPTKPQATPVEEPVIPDAETLIADKHHTGDDVVLYKETEFYGEYNFRDTILEQLDRYFVYLQRMKKNDPQSYGFYKELGATILPYSAIDEHGVNNKDSEDTWQSRTMPSLPSFFNKHRPSFGCYVYGANPATEKHELAKSETIRKTGKWIMIPKFMYFIKYKEPPPEIQPMSGGDIYKLTVWWDRPHDPKSHYKHGRPQEYAVFISADGTEITLLRMIETKMVEIAKKKDKGNGLFFNIPQRAWRIPADYDRWAAANGVDVETFLCTLFIDAVRTFERSNLSMIRVEAKKNDMAAVFGVNVRRMAYFFRDRDYVLTENGSRRRVFHMVRAHDRHTKNGTTAIRFHFRGEKEFTWAGYQVKITVPGLDHLLLPEIDIGYHDAYWQKPDEEYIGHEDTGKLVHDWIEQGVGKYRP